MSDEGKALFDKIDALFEKRAPDALVDKGLAYEDFPVLTEVIAQDAAAGWDGQERRGPERRQGERRFGERRQEGRRAGEGSGGEARAPRDEGEGLMPSLEQRLTELFIRQQLRVEEAVRKAVRDELDRYWNERRDPPRPL